MTWDDLDALKRLLQKIDDTGKLAQDEVREALRILIANAIDDAYSRMD